MIALWVAGYFLVGLALATFVLLADEDELGMAAAIFLFWPLFVAIFGPLILAHTLAAALRRRFSK